jgi:hypothetical protein
MFQVDVHGPAKRLQTHPEVEGDKKEIQQR